MDVAKLKRVFPSYMDSITLPKCAREQEITVYRACRTRKVERKSFLNTFEDNKFRISAGGDASDPQEYSLSTYEKLNDVRRFVAIDGNYDPPWVLAKGVTAPECGKSCRTREWKTFNRRKRKNSHVDWWLYEGAEPWRHFQEVDYEEERERTVQNK